MISVPNLNLMQRVALAVFSMFILNLVINGEIEGLSLGICILVIAASIILILQQRTTNINISQSVAFKIMIIISVMLSVTTTVTIAIYLKETDRLNSENGALRFERMEDKIEIDALKEEIKNINLQRLGLGK